MRFGLILPTYIDTEQRQRWAASSFESLGKSETSGLESKPLLIIVHKGHQSAAEISKHSFSSFDTQISSQPPAIHSNDGVYTAKCYEVIRQCPSVTHLALITDDWLYNPRWLIELQALVKRHPHAKANWVYHSAYKEIHKTIREENGDVLVSSINAGGLSPVEEWREWNLDWRKVPREAGNLGRLSLDLLHPQQRPGERWVTAKSYICNIGMRGVCQRPETEDFATDFVGLEDNNPVPALESTTTEVYSGHEPSITLNALESLLDHYELTISLRRKR